MQKNMKIINPNKVTDEYARYREGKQHFVEIDADDFIFEQVEIAPLDGYEVKSSFPHCCPWHENLLKVAQDFYDRFPDCCDRHRLLKEEKWFNKKEHSGLPMKIVRSISYTEHCIELNAKKQGWYKAITDYIYVIVDSFGQLPDKFGGPLGVSIYLNGIERLFGISNELDQSQRKKLTDYIGRFRNISAPKKQTDLNQLVTIYKQWLAIFPFDISYLGQFKAHFEHKLPLFCGEMETNMYTGITSYKPLRKKKLLGYLNDITQDIFMKVKELEEFKNSKQNIREKTRLEIANARHNLRQAALFDGKLEQEPYWQFIKKWLNNERDHIKELGEILANDFSTASFILNLLDGMRQLQSGDTNEYCIMQVRKGQGDKESQIRYWFRNFLFARYRDSDVTAEEFRGKGHIDLKVFHSHMSPKVIEFKGWWNSDKNTIVKQLTNYLTDAEGEGFIFMINHLKEKDISEEYCKLVTYEANGYIDGSWKVNIVPNNNIPYFESRHQSGTTVKVIYHFIFNAYF